MTRSPALAAALDRVAEVAQFRHGRPDAITRRTVVRAVDLGAAVPLVASRARVPQQTIRQLLIEAADASPSVEW